MNGKGKLFIIAKKKQDLLYCLKKHHGIVKAACEEADVSRGSYYKWLLLDESFAKGVNEIKEKADRVKRMWVPYDVYFKDISKNKE